MKQQKIQRQGACIQFNRDVLATKK